MMGPDLCLGPLRLTLAPASGGAVAGFWLDRAEGSLALMRPLPEGSADPLLSGMFPMLPFANCIRENRFTFAEREHVVAPNMAGTRLNFHGSAWRLPWVVEEEGPGHATLTLIADDGIWRYRATQVFTLLADGLDVTLEVVNRGDAPMPFGFGLHPWFPRHGEALVGFEAGGLWTLTTEGEAVAEGAIPPAADYATAAAPPRQYLNACYTGWSGRARLIWPQLRLALSMTADPVFRHLMVHVPSHDTETICLEPQSNAPCGFDGLARGATPPGVHVLASGETLSGRIRFSLTPTMKEPIP